MVILLTGGAGYIGSHTALALIESNHEVIIIDNFCNSQKSVINSLNKILNKTLTCIEGDIRDTSLVARTIKKYKVDAVMHFAGLKAVGESTQNPIEYYACNVQGTISLLEAMKISNIKILIFSSSATVYGEPKYLPINEEHPTKPTNPYGRSKLHVEEMLNDIAISDSEWKIICLRYFNPVGAHPSGLIGEDPSGIPNNLMPFISRVANGKLPKLNIYGGDYSTKDGTGVRDYIHVMDLADGHLAGLNYVKKTHGCAKINLGSGHGYSVLEIVSAFTEVSGSIIPYQVTARREGDIASCYTDVEKSSKLLAWHARRTLTEMCQSSWLWEGARSKKV